MKSFYFDSIFAPVPFHLGWDTCVRMFSLRGRNFCRIRMCVCLIDLPVSMQVRPSITVSFQCVSFVLSFRSGRSRSQTVDAVDGRYAVPAVHRALPPSFPDALAGRGACPQPRKVRINSTYLIQLSYQERVYSQESTVNRFALNSGFIYTKYLGLTPHCV